MIVLEFANWASATNKLGNFEAGFNDFVCFQFFSTSGLNFS